MTKFLCFSCLLWLGHLVVESLWTKLAGRNRGTVILKSLVKMAGTKLFMSKLQMLDLRNFGGYF